MKDNKTYIGLVEQIGEASFNISQDTVNFITFFGELLIALIYIIVLPKSLRTRDVFLYEAGESRWTAGCGINQYVDRLYFCIFAFMSYIQLRLICANIYVPSLVSFALGKEMVVN